MELYMSEKCDSSKRVCVKDISSWAPMELQNYQNFIEMTSNMIYIVALGGGFKCPRKIHLNTQCPLPPSFLPSGT